jgi:hypothetical protein
LHNGREAIQKIVPPNDPITKKQTDPNAQILENIDRRGSAVQDLVKLRHRQHRQPIAKDWILLRKTKREFRENPTLWILLRAFRIRSCAVKHQLNDRIGRKPRCNQIGGHRLSICGIHAIQMKVCLSPARLFRILLPNTRLFQ